MNTVVRHRHRVARGGLATLLVTALVLSGCAAGNTRIQLGNGLSLTEAEFRYGIAPEPHPDTTYADDVVIVGGGAQSVKSVTADGLMWTIDARAARADQLEVGKVFFITSRGVGRVLHLDRNGNDLTVVVGPVDITEVITEGDFGADDLEISMDDLIFQELGSLPWNLTDLSLSDDAGQEGTAGGEGPGDGRGGGLGFGGTSPHLFAEVPVATAVLSQPAAPSPHGTPAAPPRPRWGGAGWNQVGDGWEVLPRCCVGVQLNYERNDVSLQAVIGLYGELPKVSWRLRIANATVQEATVNINGAAGFQYRFDLQTGPTYEGHNITKRINVPVPIIIPMPPVGGVSFNLDMTQWLQVRIGTSAKGSRLSGTGAWDFSGGLGFGYKDGAFGAHTTREVRTRRSMLETATGASPAVQSIMLAHHARLLIGIGWPGFSVGPYVKVTTAMGLVRTSSLAGPLAGGVMCNQGALNMVLDVGIGYSLPQVVVTIVNFFLRAFGAGTIVKDGSIAEHKVPVFNIADERCGR
jgi:hypothetical protein